MSSQNKTITVLILGALIFFISLHFLSKTPKINKGAVNVKIAIKLIGNGEDVESLMKGVKMLKKVLEEDKNNLDAIWKLGELSLKSGQYDKAIGRFDKFISLTEEDDKASGLIYLAEAYFLKGNMEKSLKALVDAKANAKTDKILKEIDDRINIINKN